jgi:hypothetical protein
MKKAQKKYIKMKYPHYLPSSKLVWVIKSGYILEKDGVKFIVKQVLKSDNYSVFPKIVLEKLD